MNDRLGDQGSADRVFGLDAMRALAIVLVVKAHGGALLSDHIPFAHLTPRVDPVDLFFVLSGYLIGGLLLRAEQWPENGWRAGIVRFWQSRWLRTLPNYYLFLAVNIAWVLLGWAPGLINHNALAYLVFLQSLYKPIDLFFLESWSLVVEVWFYTLFPLLLFALARLLKLRFRTAFLVAVLVMIIAPTLLRFLRAADIATISEWETLLRRLTITRLDTIGYGALAVWLNVAGRGWWQRLRWPLFALGAIILIWAAGYRTVVHLPFLSTWFFTITAIAMALLLPAMSTWQGRNVWRGPVVFISHIAYAWYLTHLPLRSLLLLVVPGASLATTWIAYFVFWIASVLLAIVVYRYYEKPFMDLRERLGLRSSVKASPSS